jgi:hypothetical protein
MMTEPTCTSWRQSEVEQAGSRDGTRTAALKFYWAYRRRAISDRLATVARLGDTPAAIPIDQHRNSTATGSGDIS